MCMRVERLPPTRRYFPESTIWRALMEVEESGSEKLVRKVKVVPN